MEEHTTQSGSPEHAQAEASGERVIKNVGTLDLRHLRDIEEALGVPAGTVRYRIAMARKQLRLRLSAVEQGKVEARADDER